MQEAGIPLALLQALQALLSGLEAVLLPHGGVPVSLGP